MSRIFDTIRSGNFEELKRIIAQNPENVQNMEDEDGWVIWRWTPLDIAINHGKLEIAKFLYEKGGRPNLEDYRDGEWTPVHSAAYDRCTATLKWVFENKVLSHDMLKFKHWNGCTPFDIAIECGNLDTAKYLWEKGGRPNFEIYYCDGKWTPVHKAAFCGYTKTLKWLFTENVLSLDALKIKDGWKLTPLDFAMSEKEWETAALIRRLMYFDLVFVAMQRAKRDYHQTCVLRRLPDELLDMVVDEVAARHNLKVV